MTMISDNVQIGQNATATQNFVLKQGADGTCTLARGNVGATTQDILTVDAAGLVATPAGSKNLTLMTAQATTSGTSIDFTSIPSWVKRITVMLNGVSTNGTSNPQLQLGSGTIDTASYSSSGSNLANAASVQAAQSTTGLILIGATAASSTLYGEIILINTGSNIWVSSGSGSRGDSAATWNCGGSKTLSGTLDRIRLTTVNGTDTFDAGSVNVMYEG